MKPITTKLKVLLGAATALSLMASSGVVADDNFSNVLQQGSGNSGLVTQGGSKNRVGTETFAARQTGRTGAQTGNNNVFTFSQSGSGNEIGTGGTGFLQERHRNTATITQTSDFNKVFQATQTGPSNEWGNQRRNTLTIEQGGAGGSNIVSRISQTRADGLLTSNEPGNIATITQTNTSSGPLSAGGNVVGDNTVLSGGVDQDGFRHRATLTQTGSGNRIVNVDQRGINQGATIEQDGTSNRVSRVQQTGTGHRAIISQDGISNGTTDFVASRINGAWGGLSQGHAYQSGGLLGGNELDYGATGNNNSFGFDQNGNNNEIYGRLNSGSDNNQTGVIQDGGWNEARFNVTGDLNHVFIAQGLSSLISADNFANVTITGDGNHVGAVQNGVWNDANVLIEGAVSNNNTVNILQASRGAGNDANVTIRNGSSNNIKVNQNLPLFGLTNTATVTVQNGSSNVLDVFQNGSLNTATVYIQGSNNNNRPAPQNVFTGPAWDKALLVTGLVPGDIEQIGIGNTLTYNVGLSNLASNGNLFAFHQNGSGNVINGSTDGSNNQAVVVQQGNFNLTNFSQVGSGNVIGVSQ